jgi:poly-D-alanine transfer protein DltD
MLSPVMVKGLPDETSFQDLDRLADDIVKKHRENNIAE